MRTTFRTLCFVLLFHCSLSTDFCFSQFGQRTQPEDMFLLAPRSLTRMLREGEAAIADGRYTDAVNALGALLSDDNDVLPGDLRGQDFFIDSRLKKSVKGEAIRLLGDLPPDGRKSMEIQLGVTARKLLDEAIATTDFAAIGEVARKYVHTEAGYDAQVLLAQFNLTNGYPLAAAGILQNLLEYPAARDRYGVRLAYSTAVALLQAGKRDLALATLRLAERDFPNASLTVDGVQIAVEASTDWGPVLDRQASASSAVERIPDAWLNAGGAADRSAHAEAGLPLPNRRWEKEIHSSVLERESLLDVEEQARKSGGVILPKFELRMIDGTVLSKTTDGGVLGIDFETGKVKWERYFGTSAAPLKSMAWGNRFQNEDIVSRELQDRVWGSSAFGRISCDAERFYFISREGEELIDPRSIFNSRVSARNTNFLEGVSIAQEGAILWRVGGTDGQDEPQLAGAYFLGPPLAYEGQLYCLIEINGEMKLSVLDPRSGKLQWSQQLVQVAPLTIQFDELRQSQALSPTIADGVVLCPTGVGALVGVDLLSRSLRWGATYQGRSVATARGALGISQVEYFPLSSRWSDTSMAAQRGVVVYSPPDARDSESLFCRDVLTGEQIMSHPRRNTRYVAGLHNDHLVLVAETGASAIHLLTKKLAWQMEFPPGLKLAGKGVWQKGSMLIPLTERTVIRVNLDDGSIAGQASVDRDLGNLFAYRNQLLSVNSTSISAYYTKEALADEVERRLAANSDDTWALNQKSQLMAAAGNLDQALELSQKSFELNPASADTRFLMVDTLLIGLQKDFEKYSGLADKLDQVVELGPQRFRYLQQLASGKIRSGEHLAAFERLYQLMLYQLEMAERSQGRSSLLKLDERHSVDSDAWISTQLARTYAAASEADRAKMLETVAGTLDEVEGTMLPLRRQRLRYLAWLPPAASSLIEMAAEIRGGAEQTAAEQLVQPALFAPDAQTRASALRLLRIPATADLTHLGPAGSDYSNPLYGRSLPNGQLEEDSLVEENNALGENAGAKQTGAAAFAWNRGSVDYAVIKDYALYSIGRWLRTSGERYGRPDISVALSNSLLQISNQNGDPVGHLPFSPASSDTDNAFAKVHVHGGLLLFESPSEVAAFDLYSAFADEGDPLLWRHSLIGASPDLPFSSVGVNTAAAAALGINLPQRQIVGDQQAVVGPLTPASLIVQGGTTISGLDLMTGRRIWNREGYGKDIRFAAAGLEVAIVNPAEGRVEIVDCRDGQLIREREYRGDWTHWISHAGMMVDYRKGYTDASLILRVWNAITGEVFQDLSVGFSARVDACDSRYLVVAEPLKDRLHYMDLETLLYREIDMPITQELHSISVEKFLDQVVVLSHRGVADASLAASPANGFVVALDALTGHLSWSRAGYLQGMRFPLAQPRHSPFMAVERFVKINEDTDAAAFALIDLRDGHLVFADDSMPVRSRSFGMRLRPTEQRLELAIGDKNFQFRISDADRPPEPVFVFGR